MNTIRLILFLKKLLYTECNRNAEELIKKKYIDNNNYIFETNKKMINENSHKTDKILFKT